MKQKLALTVDILVALKAQRRIATFWTANFDWSHFAASTVVGNIRSRWFPAGVSRFTVGADVGAAALRSGEKGIGWRGEAGAAHNVVLVHGINLFDFKFCDSTVIDLNSNSSPAVLVRSKEQFQPGLRPAKAYLYQTLMNHHSINTLFSSLEIILLSMSPIFSYGKLPYRPTLSLIEAPNYRSAETQAP